MPTAYDPFAPDLRTTEQRQDDFAKDHAEYVVDRAITELAKELSQCEVCRLLEYFQDGVADLNYRDLEKRHKEYFQAKRDAESAPVPLAAE